MKVLVTGAGGFIGSALVRKLLSSEAGDLAPTHLVAADRALSELPADARLRAVEGDFGETAVLAEAVRCVPDVVFHLASVPGGLAEREFELGLRVNVHATVELLEALRRQQHRPRFVFASTIGVYGVPLPDRVDELTIPEPSLSYGAQKLIGEVLVADYSRRGAIDGCSLRLPGIVARPPQPSGLLSAFLSDSIRTLSAGGKFTFPVAADGKCWWMSRRCVVRNLLHAARLDTQMLRTRRFWLLPVLHASMQEVVDAIASVHGPHVRGNAAYRPDPHLQAQFANYPPLACPESLAAGFEHDGTLETLVQRALQ